MTDEEIVYEVQKAVEDRTKFLNFLMDTDAELLREQRLTLLSYVLETRDDKLEGLMNLIDSLVDLAYDEFGMFDQALLEDDDGTYFSGAALLEDDERRRSIVNLHLDSEDEDTDG